MTLSLKQYVENHTKGIPVPHISGAYADIGSSFSNFVKLDKTEQVDVIRHLKASNKSAMEAFAETEYHKQQAKIAEDARIAEEEAIKASQTKVSASE